jgi:tryptophan-rich sensory protein
LNVLIEGNLLDIRDLVPAMSNMRVSSQALGLLGWLLLTFSAAAVGGVASADAGNFYSNLIRPPWAPPGWLFAPAWSFLYAAMAVSAWLVWRRRGFRRGAFPLILYILHLAVNAIWTWLFFGRRLGGLALADALLLWALILVMMVAFRRISPIAALLSVPYFAWVGYACALSLSLWRLNPSVLA